MDWFGNESDLFAPPACYKELLMQNPDKVKKDFTVQLPLLCTHDGGKFSAERARTFLQKLRNTCVTKIIVPTVWDLFPALKKAGWMTSEITLQLGMGDLRNALRGNSVTNWPVRFECNLLFIPNRGWIALDIPSRDWDQYDVSEIGNLKTFYSKIEGSSIWHKFPQIDDPALLLAAHIAFGISFRLPTDEEIKKCMGTMLDSMVKGLKESYGDIHAPNFNGIFIDEPQNIENDTLPTLIELQAIHLRVKNGRENGDSLYHSETHDTIIIIGEYITDPFPIAAPPEYHFQYFLTYSGVTDYFYDTKYLTPYSSEQSGEWERVVNAHFKLRGGFIDIYRDHLKPYRWGSDRRFSPSEVQKLVEKALQLDVKELLLFNMTPYEWDTLKSFFPAIDICDAYIQWVNEICKILEAKGWFDEQKGTLTKSYQYCIYYPECWKCDKSNSAIWTPLRPPYFPPIRGQFQYDSE